MLYSSQSHWVTTIIKSSIYIRTDTCQLVIHSMYFLYYFKYLYVDRFIYISDPSLFSHFRRCSLNYFLFFFFWFPLSFCYFYILIIVTEQKQCAECQLFLINKLSVFSLSFIHESPASVSFRWLNRFFFVLRKSKKRWGK